MGKRGKLRGLPGRPVRVRYSIAVLVRMFVVGIVSVIAAAWAIVRHYTVPRAPMVVPVMPAPSATEIEIETTPPVDEP